MANHRCAKNSKDPCWICEKPPVKYAVSHHVMGAKVDPDLTVDLCRGCHMLERYLSQRKFLDNAAAIGRLITLGRFHAGLPDVRTFVYYEDDEIRAKMESLIALYLAAEHSCSDLRRVVETLSRTTPYPEMAHDIYELVYPHTKK